jgi:uncharacterized coiled-coil protein SlyX
LGYMTDQSKLDTLDFIITILTEHEAALDNLINRLDILTQTLLDLTTRQEFISKKNEKGLKDMKQEKNQDEIVA